MIDPQNNHKCKSINIQRFSLREKALSKAKKGQLQGLMQRELVCEWKLAS